ncbi:hypothetical protein Q4540_02585 [Pseudoalteromonas carrageenovora]|uniref:DUF7674 family protein n=1 Tax=Pseudoalteromonas TaxID=53246 RepID=UPI0007323ACD|nr:MULTISPECIES: hypothetical protein [Pseudoalteromonas]KTF09980.1 hypothetical protein ATS74_12415 [Pseudoalteromonas sp. H103]MDO6635286.1 hypothetical protein [Pseudoalteromonas carrageenovora]MDO6647367.1 hypothetical protein [Pseudoalteromonas carrageenovora]
MAKSEIRQFLKEIRTKFPDVVPLMEKHEKWALTFLMEEFANLTTILFNRGNLEEALEQLQYMSEKLDTATKAEFEYIDVYYTEHLFWKGTKEGIECGWPLVPDNLKKLYLCFHGKAPRVVV